MAASRTVRWAEVEYQPNLHKAAKPVPLGIIAEELNDGRLLIIVGREPIGAPRGLQLEDSWGPFRSVVGQWVENFSKDIRGFIDQIEPEQYALDELAKRWNWNVYVKKPVSAQSTMSLEQFVRRRYKAYVGSPSLGSSETQPRRRRKPWIRLSNQLQVSA
jgi:hypothetical protein